MTYRIANFSDLDLSGSEAVDLMIFAVTGESRGWRLPELFVRNGAEAWVLKRHNQFTIPEKLDAAIEDRLKDYRVIQDVSLTESLARFFSGMEVPEVSILLDVTCMPRVDMGRILDEITAEGERCGKKIELILGYVLAEYSPPPRALAANEFIRPVSQRFAGWPSDAVASTSIVVGLGYEQGKADGACEYFDSSDSWVFSPQSPIPEFDNAVLESNRAVIERARRRNKLAYYRVDRPSDALSRLLVLAGDQVGKSNPLILPFGPKVFFALSLLVAINFPEVGVWHATGDHDLPDRDHFPSRYVIGLRVELTVQEHGD